MNRLIIALTLASVLLVGCGRNAPGVPPSTPIASPPPPSISLPTQTSEPTAIPPTDATAVEALFARIRAAEQHWKDSQIASYRITVLEVHSIWSAQRMTFTVNDGHVVDQQSMCIPAPSQGQTCTIQPVESSNYLVPTLLAQARKLVEHQRPEYIRLAFDPILGYPTSIDFDNPQILDEDYGLTIEQFERLPGRLANELGQTITLRVGEAVQTEGLTVTLVRIAEDSRCPSNVSCAWSGQVVVELLVTAPNNSSEHINLTLMGTGMQFTPPTLAAEIWHIQLVSVTPYPASPDDIPIADYRITVQIAK